MNTGIYKALRYSVCLLSGMAALSVHATVAYGVRGGAQAQARDDGNSISDNHRFYDPAGVNEMFWDGLSVKASTTALAKLGGRQAASLSRAWGYNGSVGLALSSAEQITDTHYYAKSSAYADSIMNLNSSISGAAGITGQLVITGETYYAFSGGPFYNTINGTGFGYGSGGYSLNWLAQSYAPGSGGCLVLGASCRAVKQVGSSIPAGSSGGGLVPWRLELTVRAGDDFSFAFAASAAVSAGASVSIDNAAPAPLGMLAARALSAPDTSSGGPRIWLSPGLGLADTSGLVALGDGSYGFAAPVPEPAQWAAMLLGLAVLGGVARVRRSAPPVA